MINSVIIGCGKIAGGSNIQDATTHAGVFTKNKKIKLRACFDKERSKANKFSLIYKCIVENNLDDLIIKHNPQIVSVCTPDHTHFQIIKKLLLFSNIIKVILLEKPAVTNRRDYQKLSRIISRSSIKVIINHTRRFDDSHRKIKEMIDKRYFGELIRCDASYYGGWIHNGVHVVDTLNFFLENKLNIKSVSNISKSLYKDDLLMDLFIGVKSSKSKIFLNVFDESYYQIMEFDLKFTNGRIRIENFGEKFIFEKKSINKLKENILVETNKSPPISNFTAMENMVNLVCKYLIKRDFASIAPYEFKNSKKTMDIIWKGIDLASNNNYKKH